MTEVLATWGPGILSLVTVLAGGGFLKVLLDRRATVATAAKTTVEGEVAASADARAWAQLAQERADRREQAADARVERAESAAEEARGAAHAARESALECRRENEDLRDRLEDLMVSIRGCARPGCPIKPLLPVQTDPPV